MNFTSAKQLKRRFALVVLALLVAFLAAGAATFAWYIYNTSAHTTRVHMAAGTSVALYISNERDGVYNSAAVLDSFTGRLTPVSTDRIQNGFQRVSGFAPGSTGQLVANSFGAGEASDYYETQLFLKSDGMALDVYLSEIGFLDSDTLRPISTAIRVGFVVPATGREYIFAINPNQHNPEASYNTATGQEGHVLDSTRTDGATVSFTPLTANNFALYDPAQGVTTLQDASTPLCTVGSDPLELDVYIWLEGCDQDCTTNLAATTLYNLALSFCGVNTAEDAG